MQASISIRKGKKLCFFELSVKATWEGALGVGCSMVLRRFHSVDVDR